MTAAPRSIERARRAVEVLVRFSRMTSSAAAPEEVLPVLAQAAVDHLDADAAAVLQATSEGVRLAASAGLPEAMRGWCADDESSGPEVGERLRADAGGSFRSAHTLPLVAGGNLFGWLVLLHSSEDVLDPARAILAQGLVDQAATGLSSAQQYAELSRSYAELRASRDAMSRGTKLRALGQMAAGVAHDLKNIINPLSLHLQFLARAVPKDLGDAHESIVEMRQVLERGLETIERLRAFSRQAPVTAASEVADLSRIAHESLEIARSRMRMRADASYRVHEELGQPVPVRLNASEGVAAVVNLIVNAVDAMPTGGTITLRTGTEAEGGWVSVADDGPGMTPEVEQRVFEPFFTTKGEEGTGLGLAMVYATVQRHAGRLTLDTSPGKGATFKIWLPAPTT